MEEPDTNQITHKNVEKQTEEGALKERNTVPWCCWMKEADLDSRRNGSSQGFLEKWPCLELRFEGWKGIRRIKGWEDLGRMCKAESSKFKGPGMGGRREFETRSCRMRRNSVMEGRNRYCHRSENSPWFLHSSPCLFYFPSTKRKRKGQYTHSKINYLISTSPLPFIVLLVWSQSPNISKKVRASSFPQYNDLHKQIYIK